MSTDEFDITMTAGKQTPGRRVSGGVISPAQLTANTDDYAPTDGDKRHTWRLTTDTSRNLTGIVAPTVANDHFIFNVGSNDLVLVHDATSTAANRFYCPGSANVTLGANDSARIWYDTVTSRWRVEGY